MSTTLERQIEFTAPAALRTFRRIADGWNLTVAERQAVTGLARSTLLKYERSPERASVSRDLYERLSYILGIYKAINILLPDRDRANAWIRRPNTAFAGSSALDRMLGGRVTDLADVRTYLDGERSPW